MPLMFRFKLAVVILLIQILSSKIVMSCPQINIEIYMEEVMKKCKIIIELHYPGILTLMSVSKLQSLRL